MKESTNEYKVDFWEVKDSGKLSQLILQLCLIWVPDSQEYSQKSFHLCGCCGIRQHCQSGKTPFFHFCLYFPKNIIKDITGPCFIKTKFSSSLASD